MEISIGRTVHFVGDNGHCYAGIVVAHDGDTADIAVFATILNVRSIDGSRELDIQFYPDVKYSSDHNAYTWHWIH